MDVADLAVDPVDVPDGFVEVCAFDELADDEVAEFIIADVPIALARVDGTYHAVANTCPHAGGPLGDGVLSGTFVACPWHGWEFDLTSGVCALDPNLSVAVYEVLLRNNRVWVRLSAA